MLHSSYLVSAFLSLQFHSMSSIFASGYSFLIPEFEINEANGRGDWRGDFRSIESVDDFWESLGLSLSDDDDIPRKYEVFLSFRGEDTRASFTSHLYASLCNAGITVFKDDESLPRGDHISDSLLLGIEQSHIAVVIFSRNYAESGWCMKELKKIMKCHRTIGQVVVPVFYDVDPSEVRHQRGDFGNGFQKLLSKRFLKEEEVKGWRQALHEAAGISGFVVLDSRNENEAIGNIVENVIRLLDKTELFIADNPVGIESRVQDIIQWLDNIPPNDVALLGLWGMGGSGKTTLAKAIYNKIRHNFEGKSFLANIRDDWGRDGGPARLQQQLLSDMNKEEKTKIQNVELGTNILKKRLRHKKVLLILDDVNKLDQLKALCGCSEWFGSGSRIIITTRDMNILRGRVDKLHQMKGMNESESIELFSWHAFKQSSPKEDFAELSQNVIAYSGGLPLALEVLGSHLFGREVIGWKNVLEKLKKIPNDQVQRKLKISYDGLSDDTEKDIFLDIACFFIGMNRKDVIHILNGCGLCAENGIHVLIERSLVTIDDKNKLGMHDLLRDMGREIIRAEFPKSPEERSRLWFHEDVLDVLSKKIGTKATEGIALKLPRTKTKPLSTKAFKKMKKLRLLQLSGVELVGDFEHLSKDLKWLCWHGFPLTCIPTDFYQGSLVSVELENSKIKLLWKEAQMMEKLKILNLSHSHYLTQTPNFLNLPNLEKLILIDCSRLSEVSHTIGHLDKVLEINLQDCISLHNLPRSIYKLKSLKTLILSGCLKIDKLEEDLEQMESLTTLIADKTAITTVPFSIVKSKSIGYISLCGYEGFSRDVFPSIIWSWTSPINSLSSNVQTFMDMSSLVSLDVQNSNSHHPSDILKDLSKLRTLCIECGSELQLSQDVANILDALYATNYKEMESAENASQIPNTKTFTLIECNSQVHISGSKNSLRSLLIQMGMSCQVTHTLKQIILQNMATSDGGDSLLPGDSYPDWLTFNNEGSSVIFEIPQVNGCILKTMMCHVHYSSPGNITSDGLKNLLLINHTKTTIQLHKRDTLASFEDEEWHRLVSNIEPGNKLEVVVVFGKGLIVKKTTVYLMYEPMDETTEHCHAANKNVIVSSDDENDCAVRSTSPQECNKFGLSGHKRGRDDEHSNVQCQICNKIGHIASNCYHRFDPNYVAESNFQFQNQFPDQHAVVQPIFPPSQSGSLPHQQQFQSSYMPPKQVQPLQQAFQVPYTQHSQFQTVSSASVPPMSFPQAYMTNSGLSQAPTQQYQNWLQSGTSHFVTSNPTNLVQAEPVQGQEHVFLGNAQGFPIQYHFHPNAQSNFQCQNHFPHQHAVMQPIFPPFQGSLLSHQQQDHFSHMRPTQGQPLQQAHQISYPQHSQFQTVSSASVTPTSFPDSYITNPGLSLAPTQQSHNWFINSGI